MASITLISGGPGAGKSTIARAIARRLGHCLVVNVDELREMMVAGRSPLDRGWTADLIREFRLARSAAIAMAQLYVGEGVDVVIDDVCVPAEFTAHYASLSTTAGVRRILLNPDGATLVRRMRARRGPWDAFLIDRVADVAPLIRGLPQEEWILVDSSHWTVEETVEAVWRIVRGDSPARV